MSYSTTPLSAHSSLSPHPSSHQTPILPHQIVGAAHAIAPLDDLHLAHLIHSIKPPAPSWSFQSFGSSSISPPSVESNDRLRSDELADLPAPEAERLHAAYDIEDHLDSISDRLMVFGPYTPLSEVLEEVKSNLQAKKAKITDLGAQKPPRPAEAQTASRYNREAEVYVARLWVQPFEGLCGSYKWEKGGADLMRFEMDHSDHSVINCSPVEVGLSQALEVSHQLLALLHLRQFFEILKTMPQAHQFRPIDPIIWLVDPVEYAHAQLRETTEWGWSEHHVDRIHPHSHSRPRPTPTDTPTRRTSTDLFHRLHRPLSRSQLSQEIMTTNEEEGDKSGTEGLSHESLSRLNLHSQHPHKRLAENLPDWLDDLLDRRLPRILSLPHGCFSNELLHQFTYPTSGGASHRSSNPPSAYAPSCSSVTLDSLMSPLATHSPQEALLTNSSTKPSLWNIHTPYSVLLSPSTMLNSAKMTRANSVHSTDLHYIPNPGLGWARPETNPLRYYPCKACAEHAFTIGLWHRLNEEKGRLTGVQMRKHEEMEGSCLRKRSSMGIETIKKEEYHQAIGLGLKGRAVKEAMDREDDEFMNRTKESVSRLRKSKDKETLEARVRLGWDEGEAVDDVEI